MILLLIISLTACDNLDLPKPEWGYGALPQGACDHMSGSECGRRIEEHMISVHLTAFTRDENKLLIPLEGGGTAVFIDHWPDDLAYAGMRC